MIKLAVDMMYAYPNLVWAGLLEVGLKTLLFVGWIYLYVTVNGRLGPFFDFVLFLILLWFSQLVRYANFVTTSGVTATWCATIIVQ
jgi:hypothetical protein